MGYKLSEHERTLYAWQLDIPGFGEAAQEKLRSSTALISRAGGLGGPLAFQLAAAGIGKLVIAHGGILKYDDLNRQILMAYNRVGEERSLSIQETLQRFNPCIEVETIAENIHEGNASSLVAKADIVFDCAPLFEERFAMNRACVAQNKPLIDCAMFGMEGQVFPIIPHHTPCLACLYPEKPEHWQRRFPVLGAVSALIANIGALEGIKLLCGLTPSHAGKLLYVDTLQMNIQHITLKKFPNCSVCGNITETSVQSPLTH